MKITRLLMVALCLLLPLAAQEGAPPAGAEAVGKDTYRFKDREGVVWVYRKKPFGWSKVKEQEEKEAAAAPAKTAKAATGQPAIKVLRVTGEEVSFEMPSAFGKRTWTQKRSELSPEEKAALDKFEAARSK